ncbi:MAG TPA: c-type cytochrome domain-containing protein, partial [Isosphaeraceae bacterium]|nr:c-type cytochrome domain-containing protein [Isosphaeraceae bacterium]
MRHSWFAAVLLAASGVLAAENDPAPEYQKQVAPILKKYCEGCHNEDFPEGKFSLETYSALQKGTKHGPAVLPGDPEGSRMIRVLTGTLKPSMPPKDEP